MKKRTLGYSLISAICFASAAVGSEPAKEPRGLIDLETHVSQHPSAYSLGQLALAYYANQQFAKGRDTFNQAISLSEHGTGIDAGMTPYLFSSWGEAEYTHAHNFAEADRLKLKAISLWDEQTNSEARVHAHRDMVRFYRLCGKEKEADLQTQELAKLMGTTDPNILFPTHRIPRHCPACGRG